MACDEQRYSSLPETALSGSSLFFRRRFRPSTDPFFLSGQLPCLRRIIQTSAFGEHPDDGARGRFLPHTPNGNCPPPKGKSGHAAAGWRPALAAALLALLSPLAAQASSADSRTLRALESLAAKGSARAQYELALRYEAGNGVTRNERLALSLYCRAARQDHAPGAYRAGRMHLAGRGGVARDEELGRSWLRKAAALGDEDALRHVTPAAAGRAKAPDRCEPPSARTGIIRKPPAEIRAMVARMAPRYGLDPELVLAVIAVESGYRVDAVSTKNAMGLMQLIPETAERFGVTMPFDPEQNLRGGMKYLRWLLAYFDGNVTLALAGYNAGEGAVLQHKGIPPYRETQEYVVRVHSVYPRTRHPHDPGVVRSAGLAAAKLEEVADLGGASRPSSARR